MSHSIDKITHCVLVTKDSGLISDEGHPQTEDVIYRGNQDSDTPINALKDERNRQKKIVDIHSLSVVRFFDISFLEFIT